MKPTRSFTELQKLETFDERFEYLRLNGFVGQETFGFDRYLNQLLYKSPKWVAVRDRVIIRDNGCDLGILDRPIFEHLVVHHMNPIRVEDITNNNEIVFEIDNLICTSFRTHLAIHYGDKYLLPAVPVPRRHGDTSPWLY
jgi:hypothetical protein